MKQPTPWHGDLFGLQFGLSTDKGHFSASLTTGLVLTGQGTYSRTSASAGVFGYNGNLSENINMDNGKSSINADLDGPGTDNWNFDVPGMQIYGSFSAAVGYLENIKESYFNFLSQSWYNWTHPYEK